MVEWKKLGDLCEIGTGSNNREDACENGSYPFFVRSKEILRINTYLFDEEAILIPGEGGVGEIFHYIKGKYGLHQRTYRVHPKSNAVIGRFIYYYLFENFGQYINRKSFKSTATSIRKPMLIDFLIPIPSLEEQKRIEGILDTFTDSIDNLKQQIAQRRKQYEHYRDQLLDLEGKEGVEMKMLGDFAFTKVGPFGSLIHKEDYICGGVPLVNPVHMINGKVMKDDSFTISEEQASILNNYKLKINDVLFARRGEIGRCAIITEKEENYICGTGSLIVRFKDNLNSKYMLYIFSSPYCKRYLEKSAIGGTMLNINCGIVEKMIVPIPSLEEQSRIVSILDTFEASISNLEAQLAQRQKQYEYYRNQLLTFE